MLDKSLWPSVRRHLMIFSKVAGGFFCTVMAGGENPSSVAWCTSLSELCA